MKSGKITEPQCKRSVLKWLPHDREAVIQGAGIGNDYSRIRPSSVGDCVLAEACVTIPTKEPEKYAFWKAINKLESSGANPYAIMAVIYLPARGNEERIRHITQRLAQMCEQYGISYVGGHTELLESLRAPLITIMAYGNLQERKILIRKPVWDIVQIGPTAMETTMMLVLDHYEELHSRYAATYLNDTIQYCGDLSLHTVFQEIYKSECMVSYAHNLSAGGVYAGLWELGEACQCGIDVDLKQIPILQETIEVCEFFDINPYMTFSGGSVLILTDHGDDLAEHLKKLGFFARMIGQTTTGNDRIVNSGDIHSYLTPPKGDDCYRIYGV